MSKIIDVRGDGGDLVILGKALVLPSSAEDGDETPLDGSIRFNPDSGSVEVYSEQTWAPLGSNSGDADQIAHTHTISQVIGLVDALAQKANVIHAHPFSEVTGLQAALDSKAVVGHQHSIAQVTGLQAQLDALSAAVQTKALTTHTHTVPNVAGLQALLDAKAALAHTHPVSDIPELTTFINEQMKIQFTVWFPYRLRAIATYVLPITFDCTFPPNFAGSYCFTNARPQVSRTMTIIKNNTTVVGTVMIHPVGDQDTHELVTSGANGFDCAAGDFLVFQFENTTDLNLDSLAIGLLAYRKVL
jgi:hypothetical protein